MMRTPWLGRLLVVLVVVGILAVVIFLGEEARRPVAPPSGVQFTARLLNECLRMYVADFDAFPPTADPREVTALLLPYVAPPVQDWVPGGRQAPRGVRVEFLYRPGAPRVAINRAALQLGRYSRKGEVLVAYADGHLEPPSGR